MQCPSCGREVETLLAEGYCGQCGSERLPLMSLPDVLDATLCAHCGRLQTTSSWREAPHDGHARATAVVREALTIDPRVTGQEWTFEDRWEDTRNASVAVKLTGGFAGLPIERSAETRARFKNGACPDCSREMGGYFEAIIQVRGAPGSDLQNQLPLIEDMLLRRLDVNRDEGRPNSFLQKVERSRTGHDYYMGSKEAARQIAQELAEHWGAAVDESSKLVGRKDGRDLLRTTHLVRLPPYTRGDFLLIDDIPYKLLQFDRRHLQLLDLIRRVKVRRDLSRLEFKVIGRARDEQPAVVVSRGPEHVQLLDPISFKTVDVPAQAVPPAAESVPVFRHEEALYVVSRS